MRRFPICNSQFSIAAALLALLSPFLCLHSSAQSRLPLYYNTATYHVFTNFWRSNLVAGTNLVIEYDAEGLPTFSAAGAAGAMTGAEVTNAIIAQGAASTNHTLATASALTNAITAEGAASTNHTVATAAALTNAITAEGAANTNHTIATASALTNAVIAQGAANTNFAYSIGTACSNLSYSLSGGNTNLSLAIGADLTNLFLTRLPTTGGSATNLNAYGGLTISPSATSSNLPTVQISMSSVTNGLQLLDTNGAVIAYFTPRGQLVLPPGTNSAPALRIGDSANAGVFSGSSNALSIAFNGSTVFTLDANQFIGPSLFGVGSSTGPILNRLAGGVLALRNSTGSGAGITNQLYSLYTSTNSNFLELCFDSVLNCFRISANTNGTGAAIPTNKPVMISVGATSPDLYLGTNHMTGTGTNSPQSRLHVTADNSAAYITQFGTTNRPTLWALSTNGVLFNWVGTNYQGTNWAPLTTNIAAGLYARGQFAYLSSAASNYLALSGSTSDYTNIFATGGAERVITNGFTGDLTAGTLTNVYAGYYMIQASMSVWPEADNDKDEFEMEVFLNGVGQEHLVSMATATVAVKNRFNLSGIIFIPANTGISVRIQNASDATCSLPVLRRSLSISTP